jgi:metal-responsive CopG/Arc/MetJ family transcriptional regulator
MPAKKIDLDKITSKEFRIIVSLPKDVVKKIDKKLDKMIPHMSRNSWVVNAIIEKLENEKKCLPTNTNAPNVRINKQSCTR